MAALSHTGLEGPKGDRGLPGLNGNPGIPGEKGNAGFEGIPGNPGQKGEPGRDGLPGLNGVDGPVGLKGDVGIPGEIYNMCFERHAVNSRTQINEHHAIQFCGQAYLAIRAAQRLELKVSLASTELPVWTAFPVPRASPV